MNTTNLSIVVDGVLGLATIAGGIVLLALGKIDTSTGVAVIAAGAAIAKGALYVGALQGRGVWRVPLHGTRVGKPRLLFKGRYGRVRTIVRAPDGSLWLTTSNRDGRGSPRAGDDRIVRFTP